MEKFQYHIFAPYRVCPLGAHVDHQHGLVTGFAKVTAEMALFCLSYNLRRAINMKGVPALVAALR